MSFVVGSVNISTASFLILFWNLLTLSSLILLPFRPPYSPESLTQTTWASGSSYKWCHMVNLNGWLRDHEHVPQFLCNQFNCNSFITIYQTHGHHHSITITFNWSIIYMINHIRVWLNNKRTLSHIVYLQQRHGVFYYKGMLNLIIAQTIKTF